MYRKIKNILDPHGCACRVWMGYSVISLH